MGIYLNPDNVLFKESLNSKIYVDKSELIKYTNQALCTRQKYICISRPRRFGKTMAAEMLSAYYSKACSSNKLFENLKISKDESYAEHLNKYNVLFLNIQRFLSNSGSVELLTECIQKEVISELKNEFGEYFSSEEKSLSYTLDNIYAKTSQQFVIIIDEWDCIFREKKSDKSAQEKYLDFLRDLLKDRVYVALAYMTGILPIKKYGTHSALNMFGEYSMTRMGKFSDFTGFTEDEVKDLCRDYNIDFEDMKKWYDGYILNKCHIYNPKAVTESIEMGDFDSYWTSTETYEALQYYIDLNFDGLKDVLTGLVGGVKYEIDVQSFKNDFVTFTNKDDILTLLVHLGYLAYDREEKKVYIPNEEILMEFVRAMKNSNKFGDLIKDISMSEELLNATVEGNETKVAEIIDKVHSNSTSVLNYNNENALSCVISLAYYSARKDYVLIREMPTGKGFADIVFLPKKHSRKPAIVVELKYDKTAVGAVEQIKRKQYVSAVEEYSDNIILVGINYDKQTKTHTCLIEKIIHSEDTQ